MVNEGITSKKFGPSELPFSHGFRAGNLVFTSGQTGSDPATGRIVEGTEAQTRLALENVEAVLEAAGCSREDVVKVTVFLSDMRDYGVMNKVYAAFFGSPYPARSTVEARLANQRMLVEIEAVAAK